MSYNFLVSASTPVQKTAWDLRQSNTNNFLYVIVCILICTQ